MSSNPKRDDPKFDDAKKLMDAFAAQLLALNDGKAIPRQWKNYLLTAVRPAKQKRGVKADYSKIAAISKELTHARARLAAPDWIIKDKRGKAKAEIAKKVGTHQRTVEREMKARKELFDEINYEGACLVVNHPGKATLAEIRKAKAIIQKWETTKRKPIDPNMRRAHINGISEAISESITARQKAEETAKREAARRKYSEWVTRARDNF